MGFVSKIRKKLFTRILQIRMTQKIGNVTLTHSQAMPYNDMSPHRPWPVSLFDLFVETFQLLSSRKFEFLLIQIYQRGVFYADGRKRPIKLTQEFITRGLKLKPLTTYIYCDNVCGWTSNFFPVEAQTSVRPFFSLLNLKFGYKNSLSRVRRIPSKEKQKSEPLLNRIQ